MLVPIVMLNCYPRGRIFNPHLTTIKDSYNPYPSSKCFHLQLIQEGPDEVLSVASSTLCNLLLEFSPSKEVS